MSQKNFRLFFILILFLAFNLSPKNANAIAQYSFADIAEKSLPSVVQIKTKDENELLFNFKNDMHQYVEGTGSGFIIDEKGYIVTNYHVIRDYDIITVRLYNDQIDYPAEIIGFDESTDLAVIKIDVKQKLPVLEFGDSNKIRIGDPVVAIGHPFWLGYTVTSGIISAKTRYLEGISLEEFIQTDAPLNIGNSGGPILDTNGEVIAVSSVITSPNGGSIGLGFGIPSTVVKKIVTQIKSGGYVERGWLAVMLQPVNKNVSISFGLDKERGALISDVIADGPAQKAGIKPGDIILQYNNTPIITQDTLVREVKTTAPGTKVKMKIWRDKKEITKEVTIESRPKNIDEIGQKAPISKNAFGIQFEITDKGLKVVNIKSSSLFYQYIPPGSVIHTAKLTDGTHKKIKSVQDFKNVVQDAKKSKNKLLTLIVNIEEKANFYIIIKLDD